METTSLLLNCLFGLLAGTSLFIAYYFSISKDGELRKLMIVKHYCLAFMFTVFAIMVWFPKPDRIYAIAGALPYTYSVVKLIFYLIKQTKR